VPSATAGTQVNACSGNDGSVVITSAGELHHIQSRLAQYYLTAGDYTFTLNTATGVMKQLFALLNH
jgi:hypothetical protein